MADLRKLAEAREWISSVDEHHAQEDPDPWICDVRDGNDRLRVVLAEVDRLTAIVTTAASRWLWTIAATPDGGAILSYRAPGQSGYALIASALPRPDGMLAVTVLGQKRTAADDLPAALATIRAVLGGDVPEIPNERSES